PARATQSPGPCGGTTRLASLTTDAPGSTLFSTGIVSTTGSQTYNDPVSANWTSPLTFNSLAGDLTFAQTLDYTLPVLLNAGVGAVNLGGTVGGTDAPSSLSIDAHTLNCGAITAGTLSATFVAGAFTGPLHMTRG